MSSRDDEMDKGEGFLGRWIKRKAQARELPEAEPSDVDHASGAQTASTQADGDAAAAGTDAKTAEPVFDLASLPSIEDIGAQTKITDFMREEVPAALRNAALRRAWAADPAIRDYVNPAREYAYDWNTPGGVPGNGPLQEGFEALKQVAEAFQSRIPDHTLGVREDTGEKPTEGPEMEPTEPSALRLSEPPALSHSSQHIAKNEVSEDAETPAPSQEVSISDINRSRRRHGGASPS